jgi:D-glycero-beta-D-manno-heptose-7-phosphate kinase
MSKPLLTMEKTQAIISNFNQLNVMVIGDLMVDKYVWGSCIRLSTEAPVPVVKVVREDYALGGAGNIAFHAANLGAISHLCGIVGYDDAAYHLRTNVARAKIDATGIFPSAHRPTTQKVRIVTIETSRLMGRFDYESSQALLPDEEATLKRFIETYADDLDVLILSDYDRGMFKSASFIDFLYATATKRHVFTAALSRSNEIDHFTWVDHLLISSKLAAQILNTKLKRDVTGIGNLADEIYNLHKIEAFTIYDSMDQQMLMYRGGTPVMQYRESPIQLIDQTGMGDVALVISSLAFACEATPEEAIILAYKGFISAGQQVGTGQVFSENLLLI